MKDFFTPCPKCRQKWLDNHVSSWPKPNTRRMYGLSLKQGNLDVIEALEAALTRPDIDTLQLHAYHLRNENVRSLITELLAKERDWKVEYDSWCRTCTSDPKEIAWEASALRPVRYLQLDCLHKDLVRSLPNVKQVDLAEVQMNPVTFFDLYQEEDLAKKIPHVTLRLDDDDDDDGDDSDPVRFPPTANKYLRSFAYYLDGVTSQWFIECIQQLSQLENLRYFNVFFRQDRHDDYSECIEALCSWIQSPTCQLTHFAFFPQVADHDRQLGIIPSLMLFAALSQNRSIQEIKVNHWSPHVSVSKVILPQLSRSAVHHVKFGFFDRVYEKDLALLLKWQIQMRPFRFVTILPPTCYDEILYVTYIHARWKKWQTIMAPKETAQSGTGGGNSFLAMLPPSLWARELHRMDKTRRPQLQNLSLDATYYVLQHWLTSISKVPPQPTIE